MQSKNLILYIGISFMVLCIVYSAYVTTYNFAIGQIASTSKIFEKSTTLPLDNFTYTNGQVISYDRVNYTPEQIVIHRWNEISTINQQLIITELTGLGYVEREEFDPQELPGAGAESR